ncbi:MAG: 50S ribosomal protein L1, partial [Betaproteobacteria bacterium HGW-Betaproteobacteria-20]
MAKRIDALRAMVDRNKLYPVVDGLSIVKENA